MIERRSDKTSNIIPKIMSSMRDAGFRLTTIGSRPCLQLSRIPACLVPAQDIIRVPEIKLPGSVNTSYLLAGVFSCGSTIGHRSISTAFRHVLSNSIARNDMSQNLGHYWVYALSNSVRSTSSRPDMATLPPLNLCSIWFSTPPQPLNHLCNTRDQWGEKTI